MTFIKKHIALLISLTLSAILLVGINIWSLDSRQKFYLLYVVISMVMMTAACEEDSVLSNKFDIWATRKFHELEKKRIEWLKRRQTWRDLREDNDPSRAVRRLARRKSWWNFKKKFFVWTILTVPVVAIGLAILAIINRLMAAIIMLVYAVILIYSMLRLGDLLDREG